VGMIGPHRPQANPFLFGLTGLLVLWPPGGCSCSFSETSMADTSSRTLCQRKERLQTTLKARESTIGILKSQFSEQLFQPESTWLRDNITTWEHFAAGMDLPYDIIDDQEVESGTLGKYKLVVLPGSRPQRQGNSGNQEIHRPRRKRLRDQQHRILYGKRSLEGLGLPF